MKRSIRQHPKTQLSDQFEEACVLIASTFVNHDRDADPFGYHGHLARSGRAPELVESYEKLEAQKAKLRQLADTFLTECQTLARLEESFLRREYNFALSEDDWLKRREEILADGESGW